jgi:hypothetical protein
LILLAVKQLPQSELLEQLAQVVARQELPEFRAAQARQVLEALGQLV